MVAAATFNATPDSFIPTLLTQPRPAFQVAKYVFSSTIRFYTLIHLSKTDCNTFFTGPEFNKASKFCNSNFVCDYDCPSGSVKGCNGRPGCYSICTPASAIPAKMRRQAPVNSRDKRMNGMNPIIHLPAVASENGNEEKLCPESGLV
ncbi:hypothetical protein FRC02_007458, partial [Tulasnella sp. 418]